MERQPDLAVPAGRSLISRASLPCPTRCSLAGLFALLTGVVWSHAFAGVLRVPLGVSPETLADCAVGLTLAGFAAGVAGVLAGVLAGPRCATLGASLAASLVVAALGSLALLFANPALGGCAFAPLPAAALAVLVGQVLEQRLPSSIDRLLEKRALLRLVWWAFAALALTQAGRLATWVSDPSADWFVSTRHPFFEQHECANAYVYGAELALRGEPNVYDAQHYPGIHPPAEPTTHIAGLAPEDPFQYPPQFLLAPALALSVLPDYDALQALWFGINVSLCLGAALVLACWVAGPCGSQAALLLPVVCASFPVLYNFQYGQFHFAAVALAVLGWVAAHRKRPALAGVLLSCAILSKLFPAVLLIPLVASRRWRTLAWTGAATASATVATAATLGLAPLRAFCGHHVERLVDGRAFAFDEAWPDFAGLLIAGNQGVRGIVEKLEAMGLTSADATAADWVVRLCGVALLAFGVAVGRRNKRANRAVHALECLGLLGLGSMMSAGAWADYVPLTCVLLLTYLLPLSAERPIVRGWIAVSAPFHLFLLGAVPLGSAAEPSWMLPLSLFSALAMLVTFGMAVSFAHPYGSSVLIRSGRPL